MTVALLLTAGIILFTTFRSELDFFHPTRIYVLLYLLLFSVYFLNLCRFQERWSPTTLMLFSGAVIMFIGGGAILSFYARFVSPAGTDFKSLSTVTQKLSIDQKQIDWNWFIKVTFVLFSVFVVSYIHTYLKYEIIPITSQDPNEERFLYLSGSMFTAFAGGSGPLVLLMGTELLFVKLITRRQKIAVYFMLIITFVLYFTLVTRMPLVRSCIYFAVLYHYFKKQISFRQVIFFASLAILLFVFGSIIRIDIARFSELASSLRIKIPSRFFLFINPYAYAVNNIWNMDYGFKKFIDGLHEYNYSYGFEMFRGLFYFFKIEGILQYAYNFDSLYNESVVKVTGLNTVIYVWHLYKDFGLFGVFFVSLFLSISLHLFYYNTLIAPTYLRITVYAIVVSMIVFSFMIPLWSFWNIYYEIAFLVIAHKKITFI